MKAAKKFCFNILLKAILPRYSRSINYKKALEFKNIKNFTGKVYNVWVFNLKAFP